MSNRTTCNFRCPHCQVPYGSKPAVYLDGERFANILRQAPDLVRIKLQGMGEPLLNKHLVGMLKLGEARGVSMSFFSNASVRSRARRRPRSRPERHRDHLPASTARRKRRSRESVPGEVREGDREHEAPRRGERRETGARPLRLDTRDGENLGELARIVRLAKDIGFDRLTIQTFLSDWGKEDMKERTGAHRVDQIPKRSPPPSARPKVRLARSASI